MQKEELSDHDKKLLVEAHKSKCLLLAAVWVGCGLAAGLTGEPAVVGVALGMAIAM